MDCLPKTIKILLKRHPRVYGAINNIGWLFFDRVLRMGAGLLVGVWVARYLGPEQFGLFSYGVAILVLFNPVATLGLNEVVVRNLIMHPDKVDVTLGTAFILQLMGGGVACLLAVATIYVMRPDDLLGIAVISIFSYCFLFKAAEVVKYLFEARVSSKYVVWVENGAYFACSVIKVMLILGQTSLMAFAWIVFAEAALVAGGLLVAYRLIVGSWSSWQFRIDRAAAFLRDSWPLILSGVVFAASMRIDQIMLARIAGDRIVGVYSAAVRVSEVFYFIPIIFVASIFPAIVQNRRRSVFLYYQSIQRLYVVLIWTAIFLALIVASLSTQIVGLLYGDEYREAAHILSIHIWGGVFVFFSVAWSKWMVNEGFQATILKLHLLSLVANILLNFLLIQKYGAIGAAIATVASYSLAHTVFAFLFRNQRIAVKMFWRAFNPFCVIAR